MSMLKPEIKKVCYFCGKEANAGVHIAKNAKGSTDEYPICHLEIIVHSCKEHGTSRMVRQHLKDDINRWRTFD